MGLKYLSEKEKTQYWKAKATTAVQHLNHYKQQLTHPNTFSKLTPTPQIIDGVVDCIKDLKHHNFIDAFLHCVSRPDRVEERLLDWIEYIIQLHKSLLYKKANWNF